MAAGRPLIVSDFPAWRALLEPYECCLFVDPLDIQSAATAIDRLLNDNDLALEMGGRGRAALVDNFTFEHEAERLVGNTIALLALDRPRRFSAR